MKTRNNTATWMEKYKRWHIKVTNDEGVRRQFYASTPGKRGQTECNCKADEWLASCAPASDRRCDKLIAEWLKDVKINTGTSNYTQLNSNAQNWIIPQIGALKFSKLTPRMLQDIINNAYTEGKLHKKSLQNIRGALSSWLNYCQPAGSMTRLTTSGITIPTGAVVGERHILQPNELSILFKSAKSTLRGKEVDSWYIHAWRLAVVTGFRPGEIIALQRKHNSGTKLLVRGSVNEKQEHTTGKNNNAIRDYAMPQIAQDIVADQLAMLKSVGIVSPYIFPDPQGLCSRQQTMRKQWEKYRQYNGISKVTPYELRHTFVSVTAGRSDITLSELKSLVGHSKNMDTLGVYSHELNDQDMRISSHINSAFSDLLK